MHSAIAPSPASTSLQEEVVKNALHAPASENAEELRAGDGWMEMTTACCCGHVVLAGKRRPINCTGTAPPDTLMSSMPFCTSASGATSTILFFFVTTAGAGCPVTAWPAVCKARAASREVASSTTAVRLQPACCAPPACAAWRDAKQWQPETAVVRHKIARGAGYGKARLTLRTIALLCDGSLRGKKETDGSHCTLRRLFTALQMIEATPASPRRADSARCALGQLLPPQLSVPQPPSRSISRR
jgi:hypothetical protein